MTISPTDAPAISTPPRDLAQVKYEDVRRINLHIFRTWVKRHVDASGQIEILDNPAFGGYDVFGPPRLVNSVLTLADCVKDKGWP